MKLKSIVFPIFLLIVYSTVGFSMEKIRINNRDDAVKYYKEKFRAIRFHKKGKEVSFDFSDSKILTNDDLKYLKYFPETTVVLFGGNGVSDKALKYLEDKENLVTLGLYNTNVNGEGFRFLRYLKKLEGIVIFNSPFSDQGLKFLSEINFNSAVEIHLSSTKITDEGLKYLSKIKLTGALYLANTMITDEGLKYLANQKDLVEIDVRGTKVTKAGVQWLDKQLPNTGIEYGKYVPQRD